MLIDSDLIKNLKVLVFFVPLEIFFYHGIFPFLEAFVLMVEDNLQGLMIQLGSKILITLKVSFVERTCESY